MDIDYSKPTDFEAWLSLAREVETLFGPMADEADFQKGLKKSISENTAFCIRSASSKIKGGVIISIEANEIAWLAVSQQYRGKGYGRQLVQFAISKLNTRENVFVQTFAASVPEGKSARKLYSAFGFTDFENGGMNPAGIPTVIMKRSKQET